MLLISANAGQFWWELGVGLLPWVLGSGAGKVPGGGGHQGCLVQGFGLYAALNLKVASLFCRRRERERKKKLLLNLFKILALDTCAQKPLKI